MTSCSVDVQKWFVEDLTKDFQVEVSIANIPQNEVSFLERTYVWVDEGLLVKPGQYAAKMIHLFEENYGGQEAQTASNL